MKIGGKRGAGKPLDLAEHMTLSGIGFVGESLEESIIRVFGSIEAARLRYLAFWDDPEGFPEADDEVERILGVES